MKEVWVALTVVDLPSWPLASRTALIAGNRILFASYLPTYRPHQCSSLLLLRRETVLAHKENFR
jgi:hypothetical protein